MTMLPQVIILCCGLGSGSVLYKKIKNRIAHKNKKKISSEEACDQIQPMQSMDNLENRDNLPQKAESENYEKEVDHNLRLSLITTAIASAGFLFYAPLSIVSAIMTFYTTTPLFKKAINAIFKEKRSRIEILDSIAVLAGLLFGYYVVSALCNTLYYSAEKLRIKTENKTKQSMMTIFGEQPRSAWLLKNDIQMEVPLESLQPGDIVVVNAGEVVPVDGTIEYGIASIDQHRLTGESQPSEKAINDKVFATTVVISGKIHIQVQQAGEETVAAQIASILKNTTDFTEYVENMGKEIADESTIPALALSLGAFSIVGPLGTVALLSSNFMDTLRLAAPVSILNFLHIASQNGILIKDGRSLQSLMLVDTVIFDKTGTLTLDQPFVKSIYTIDGITENDLLTYAAAAEYRQKHPIALAILEKARERGLNVPKINDAGYKIGYGISVKIEGQVIKVGSERFMEIEGIHLPDRFCQIQADIYERSCSIVYVASDDQMIGIIELETTIRPEAEEIIRQLKSHNMAIHIISGDHEKPTQIMAKKLGIDHYFAEVLPEDKAILIENLQKKGKKVCFIGDGINDGIALKKADASVSICGASTVATDNAQIVLMDQSLTKLPDLFNLAYDFENNIKNIFYSVSAPGIFCIGGVFFAHFSLAGVLAFYGVSLISGSTVSMVPALKAHRDKKAKESLVSQSNG